MIYRIDYTSKGRAKSEYVRAKSSHLAIKKLEKKVGSLMVININ